MTPYFKRSVLVTCLFLVLLATIEFNRQQKEIDISDRNRQHHLLGRKNAYSQGRRHKAGRVVAVAASGQSNHGLKGPAEPLDPEGDSTCRAPKPTLDSQALAEQLFFTKPPPTCGPENPWELCFIWVSWENTSYEAFI